MITRESVIRSGWPVRPLADLVEFLDNRRKPVTEKDRVAGPYIYYGANGPQGTIDQFIFDEPTILVAEDGGNFGQEGRTIAYQVEGKYWVNNHAHVLRPKPGVDIRFLCRHLEHYDVTPFVNGTTRGKLTKGNTEQIPIALPPLAEQKRIAAVLDKADDLRGKRRQALATLDTLLQSVFLDMFGDPVTNPKGWPKVPLAQLCKNDDDIRCGPFGTQLLRDEFTHEGIPLWGIKHVNVGFSIPTDEFVSAKKAKQLGVYSIEPGDIVMTRKGTIGNCAVYPEGWEAGIMHSDLLRLRVDRAKCHPVFLSHQLHYSPDVEVQLARIAGGAIMQGVNVSRLKSLAVLAPPEPQQLRFLKANGRVIRFRAAQVAALAKLEVLFGSLQSAAFAGTLFNGGEVKAAVSPSARPAPVPV